MKGMHQEATDLAKQDEVRLKWLPPLKKVKYIARESSGQAEELQTVNDEQAKLTEDSEHFYSELSYSKLNNFMLYFRVRKVQFALSIELKNT